MYPEIWKIAKVILIPKEGKDSQLPSAYRPICLLSIWAKLLDKIITPRLTNYLESNNIINPNQYGFRKGLNTVSALNKVSQEIMNNLYDNFITCLISLDISNAFNTVRVNSILEIMDL